MTIETKGKLFGIRLVPRHKNDNHICLQILTEDDGQWFKHGDYFNSAWIDDLIEQLQITKSLLQSQNKNEHGLYEFKHSQPDNIYDDDSNI